MKQLNLIEKEKLFYGGQLIKGKRKMTRPLSTKKPIHLVLKAHDSINLFLQREFVISKIKKYCSQFNVQLFSHSVQKDHIHLVLLVNDHVINNQMVDGRSSYTKWIRALTGVLARKYGRGLWKLLPFSRLVHWGKDLQNVQAYVQKNEEEVLGIRSYELRKPNYKKYISQ